MLSNPDMVHSGILPHHPRWAKLFENLRYVVIDELHAYRGVFGSHLCNVLRRLRRICRHYGSNPVFICSSATIANPRELAERLTEQPFELVDKSGAPRGEKFFVFVNPPVVNQQLGIRRSYLGETRRIAVGVPQAQPPAHRLCAEPAVDRDPDDVSEGRLRGRAGRAGADSRLSRRLSAACGAARSRRGCAKAPCARSCRPTRSSSASTSARSTCAVMAGYPGTIAATWQRAGRAGRRSEPIGRGDGGEQRAARSVRRPQPVVLLRRVARAGADRSRQPAHPRRSRQVRGVRAAVHRHARRSAATTSRRSSASWPSRGWCIVPAGRRTTARQTMRPWTWTNESYPADAVSLRSVSSDNFVVVDTTDEPRVIGETDFTSGPSTLHPEGDLHRRRPAVSGRAARFRGAQGVRPRDRLRLLHDAITYTRVTILDTFAEHGRRRSRSHGEVHVVSRVVGFKKIKFYTNENVGSGELDLPEQQMHTTSYWLTIPAAVMASLPYASDDRRDGVVGLAFAMRQVAQLLLMCDGHDIGISIDSGEAERAEPARRDRSDLRLRQLSGRHRLQRAAVPACTTSCSTARGG